MNVQKLLEILSMALAEHIQNFKQKTNYKQRTNSAPNCQGKTMIIPWTKGSF